jgi:hypothetical protein
MEMKKILFSLVVSAMLLISITPVNAFDHGEFWLSISKLEKSVYSKGFLDGYEQGYGGALADMDMLSASSPHQKEIFHRKLNQMDNLKVDVLADLVTQFYQDPANRLIHLQFLCDIAMRKLMGTSKTEIEQMLETARKIAVGKSSK